MFYFFESDWKLLRFDIGSDDFTSEKINPAIDLDSIIDLTTKLFTDKLDFTKHTPTQRTFALRRATYLQRDVFDENGKRVTDLRK